MFKIAIRLLPSMVRTTPTKTTKRVVGSKAQREPSLVREVIDGLYQNADAKTKEWFTNYVKGTTWVGCKVPTVRKVVKEVSSSSSLSLDKKKGNTESSDALLLNSAVELLQQDECDVKLAGMLLLSELMSPKQLATKATLQRLHEDVLLGNYLQDWSSADWFATKVLRNIVFSGDHSLVEHVLNLTSIPNSDDEHNYTFVRRCGVVSFLGYEKQRDKLPTKFGQRLIEACEQSLVMSPEERFTQTGVAWVLRYVLLQSEESKDAFEMILRNGPLWNMEAKRSLVEKIPKNDRRRNQILKLQQQH